MSKINVSSILLIVFSLLIIMFFLSAKTNFKYGFVAVFIALLLSFLFKKKTNALAYGLLCFGFGFAGLMWGELWNARLITVSLNPVLKIIDAGILGYLLWKKS